MRTLAWAALLALPVVAADAGAQEARSRVDRIAPDAHPAAPETQPASPATPLPAGAEPAAADGSPAWSAVGTLLAVERATAGGTAVEVVDLKRRARRIVEGRAPRLSPDGRHVAVRRAAEEAPGGEAAADPDLDPDLDLDANPEQIVLIDVTTGAELALPGIAPDDEVVHFSGCGTKLLATLAVGEGRTSEVFLLDLRGVEPALHQLTQGGGRNGRWLGKGERAIYEGRDDAGRPTLMLRDQGGFGGPRRFWSDSAPTAPRMPQGMDPATIS